ncbi:MAG: MlaE family lipid ABC transporter permease subunit [Thermodesulfobacteriota bacterium]
MNQSTAEVKITENGSRTVFSFKGELDMHGTAAIWEHAVTRIRSVKKDGVVFDMTDVHAFDSAGAALVLTLEKSIPEPGTIDFVHFDEKHEQTLNLFRKNYADPEHFLLAPEKDDIPTYTGKKTVSFFKEVFHAVAFTGELSRAVFKSILHPRLFRWRESLHVFDKAGINALFIVGLISFIVGLVMAFQAAIPMRMFGAEIYVADLIGLAMTRELGPLMTAIVLAGRSGSAFAAETGTMKINEEIDAMYTIGIDPVFFIVVPRVFAAALATPLLTVFADFIGIAGGGMVLFSMDHPVSVYTAQILNRVTGMDMIGGLIKSVVFGILIAATGCFRGLQTESGPGGVGVATTKSVVSSIVIIAVADALFSILYYILEI